VRFKKLYMVQKPVWNLYAGDSIKQVSVLAVGIELLGLRPLRRDQARLRTKT
jgi:hypothetical protein